MTVVETTPATPQPTGTAGWTGTGAEPWPEPAPPPRFLLTRAHDDDDLTRVRHFRSNVYESRSNLTVDDGIDVDRRAHLFSLTVAGHLVGSGRILPLPDPDAGTNAFDHPLAADHGMDAEVGRLAVIRKGSAKLLLATVGLGSYWMLQHSDLRTFVGYCNQRLAPLYERIGARDLGVEVLHGGTGRTYRLVAGRFDVVAGRALTLLGLDNPSEHLRDRRYSPALGDR